MSSHDLTEQYVHTAIAALLGGARNLVANKVVQTTTVIFLTLSLTHSMSRFLSKWTMQTSTTNHVRDPPCELVLITGGCSGIRKQVMKDLSRTGVRVIIFDIKIPDFELPDNVAFYEVNVTSSREIADAAADIRQKYGEPTVLVNNASVGYNGTIPEAPQANIRLTFEVNTLSHCRMAKEFLLAMIKANYGHVVTVASTASFVAVGEMVGYCCSKASVLAFHKGLRQEPKYSYSAPIIIHPTWAHTPMIKALAENDDNFSRRILTCQVVSTAICEQILKHRNGQVIVPGYQSPISLVRGMPTWIQECVRTYASNSLKRIRNPQHSVQDVQ
ncbi:hypothetical protein N7522_006329 [Penicillium canescens]|nr:hypothetical protein N7522_006329 [Penicillium canescens]